MKVHFIRVADFAACGTAAPPNLSLETDALQRPFLQRLRIFASETAAVTRRSTYC